MKERRYPLGVCEEDVERFLVELLQAPEAQEALGEVLGLDPEQYALAVQASTYEEVGMLTLNHGVQLTLPDGGRFALSVQLMSRGWA